MELSKTLRFAALLCLLCLPAWATGPMLVISGTANYVSTGLNLNTGGNLSVSGTANIAGTVSTSQVSTTNVSVTTAVQVGANTLTAGLIPVAMTEISTTSSSCSLVGSSVGISGCIRVAQGSFNVSFTTAMSNVNYHAFCFPAYVANTSVAVALTSGQTQRTDSFYVQTLSFSGSTTVDNVRVNCIVYN